MRDFQKMFFPHIEAISERSRKFYQERFLQLKNGFLKKKLIWKALFRRQLEILRK